MPLETHKQSKYLDVGTAPECTVPKVPYPVRGIPAQIWGSLDKHPKLWYPLEGKSYHSWLLLATLRYDFDQSSGLRTPMLFDWRRKPSRRRRNRNKVCFDVANA